MHCNNFAPTIYTNPIYSFMKSKPALAGIQLPIGFACDYFALLWFFFHCRLLKLDALSGRYDLQTVQETQLNACASGSVDSSSIIYS